MKTIKLAVLMAMALPAFGRDGNGGGGIIIIDGDRQGQIEIGEVVSGGTACNYEDSVDLQVEDDKLKIEFDDYKATLRGARLERATCMLSAQISWPRGKRIVVRDLSLKGFAAVSSSTRASVSAEVFMTGDSGDVLSSTLSGVGNFHETEHGEVYSSDCSGSGLLRLNSNIRLIGPTYGGAGHVEVRKLSAELSLESCR